LQGAGTRFNRLAGPNAVPGFYNGVLIARVNTDISVADFEMGLRDLVSNVENSYWDLYFAYRDLDAKIQLRNAALDTWKRIKILVESDQAGGQIEREAQAREQYFRYEEEVQNALAGTLQSATTNNNGASGGSFRGIGGVLVSERRLRLAIGLPITDGRMIRPADAPTLAKVNFAWPEASDDAVARRPELMKQRLTVKRREMEYVAARNFLLPRFDVLGRYRFRGLGKDLIGDQSLPFDPADPNGYFARSSLANLAAGNFQEWQLGGEITMPVGFRRGWAAVRNAQLNLARDKTVLEEQERQVMHDLSNAFGDMQRAYQIMETTYNRRLAAQQNVEILRFRVESSQPVSAEQLLEAERRLAEADIQFHRSLVEHMLAIKNVHFEKGTLLEYGRIQLAEQFAAANAAQHAPAPSTAPPSAPAPSGSPPLAPGSHGPAPGMSSPSQPALRGEPTPALPPPLPPPAGSLEALPPAAPPPGPPPGAVPPGPPFTAAPAIQPLGSAPTFVEQTRFMPAPAGPQAALVPATAESAMAATNRAVWVAPSSPSQTEITHQPIATATRLPPVPPSSPTFSMPSPVALRLPPPLAGPPAAAAQVAAPQLPRLPAPDPMLRLPTPDPMLRLPATQSPFSENAVHRLPMP
jgi:outer membrane protein TolC